MWAREAAVRPSRGVSIPSSPRASVSSPWVRVRSPRTGVPTGGTFQGSALGSPACTAGPPESWAVGVLWPGRRLQEGPGGLSRLWGVAGRLCEGTGVIDPHRGWSWHGGRSLTLAGSRGTGKPGTGEGVKMIGPVGSSRRESRAFHCGRQCPSRRFALGVLALCFV